MKLSEWRAQRVETHLLPSGLEVKLKRVVLLDLAANGHIPTTLDALVKKATSDGFGISEVQDFMPLVNEVVKACLVSPELAETSDDTHVTLDEIPAQDRLDIFTWANSAANALQSFRREPKGDVESLSAGEGVQQPA